MIRPFLEDGVPLTEVVKHHDIGLRTAERRGGAIQKERVGRRSVARSMHAKASAVYPSMFKVLLKAWLADAAANPPYLV